MIDKIREFFRSKKAIAVPAYTCRCCGKQNHGWPSIAYNVPNYYNNLSEEDKETIAELTSDTCVIEYPEETNQFIRCVLLQGIIDSDEELHYGLWVSLSEKSFYDYLDNYDDKQRDGAYFGWISNDLLGYDTTTEIPASVYLGKDGNRPEVVPHRDFDHPFVRDYYNGITMEEAHKRIAIILAID